MGRSWEKEQSCKEEIVSSCNHTCGCITPPCLPISDLISGCSCSYHLSCSALAATECQRLGGFNHRDLLLTVLETGTHKIKAPADSVSGESSLPDLQTAAFSWCARERGNRLSAISSSKGTNPIMRAWSLPQSLISKYHHIGGLAFQHVIWGAGVCVCVNMTFSL